MNWYYVENQQQTGPVTDEQLEPLKLAGKIKDDTLVWREGLPNWMPYREALAQANQVAAASAAASSGGNEVVCAECGKLFPASETIPFGKVSVCAACKPVFLQKLSEGAKINTGGLAYATISSRFAAAVLDGIIVGAANLSTKLLVWVVYPAAVEHTLPYDGRLAPGFLALQLVLTAINMTVAATYEGIMIAKYGATLGKMACKIKVVTADGGKVGYGRAFGRYFAKLLSVLTCLIGYLIALTDEQKRTLHDRICNTRVVIK